MVLGVVQSGGSSSASEGAYTLISIVSVFVYSFQKWIKIPLSLMAFVGISFSES